MTVSWILVKIWVTGAVLITFLSPLAARCLGGHWRASTFRSWTHLCNVLGVVDLCFWLSRCVSRCVVTLCNRIKRDTLYM